MSRLTRWRSEHPDKVAAQRRRYYHTSTCPAARRTWTVGEVQRVLAKRRQDRELALELGRTVMAIQVARARFKGEIGERSSSRP